MLAICDYCKEIASYGSYYKFNLNNEKHDGYLCHKCMDKIESLDEQVLLKNIKEREKKRKWTCTKQK